MLLVKSAWRAHGLLPSALEGGAIKHWGSRLATSFRPAGPTPTSVIDLVAIVSLHNGIEPEMLFGTSAKDEGE